MAERFKPLHRKRDSRKDLQLREAKRAAHAVQGMFRSDGWKQYAKPFIDKWIADATAQVMGNLSGDPGRDRFMKGGVAALRDLREYLSAINATEERLQREKHEDARDRMKSRAAVAGSGRF